MGGFQSERKKWIHCFGDVSVVLFVASLSCYDELMFEDDTINQMHDQLELFGEICNLKWFETTPIILVLNKKDLFEKKIHVIPLNVCFTEYDKVVPKVETTDQDDLSDDQLKNQYMIDSCNYIKDKFISHNTNSKTRQIHVHIINAMDRNNVQSVFDDAVSNIIKQSLFEHLM
eukprot:125964_1